MAKYLVIILLVILARQVGHTHSIPPTMADRSVVYSVIVNSTGVLINFTNSDANQVIDRFNATTYIGYNLERIEHPSWVRYKNKSVIKTDTPLQPQALQYELRNIVARQRSKRAT